MKKICAFMLTLSLCFLMAVPVMGYENNETYFIVKTLNENSELFKTSVPANSHSVSSVDSISFAIKQDLNTAAVDMKLEDIPYSAVLHGETEKIVADVDLLGYVGVFEGVLSSSESTETLPVIADVTFTQDELFVALTIGETTETSNPTVKFYGDLSEKLGQIATKNSELHMQAGATTEICASEGFESDATLDSGIMPAAYDTSIKYQASTRGNFGSHVCGRLSLFHPSYASSSGNTIVHAKVNTNSSGVLNYLRQDLGYNNVDVAGYALSVRPNRFEITVTGQHEYFKIMPKSYTPQDSETIFTVPIPFYTKISGFQIVDANFVTSKTSATPRKYNLASNYDNVIDWDMSKVGGWESAEFDGDYNTNTGMSVMIEYGIFGDIQNNMSEFVSATTCIRYEYFLQTPTAVLTLNISTPSLTVRSLMTFIPLT